MPKTDAEKGYLAGFDEGGYVLEHGLVGGLDDAGCGASEHNSIAGVGNFVALRNSYERNTVY
jgi:hypothetical protein